LAGSGNVAALKIISIQTGAGRSAALPRLLPILGMGLAQFFFKSKVRRMQAEQNEKETKQ